MNELFCALVSFFFVRLLTLFSCRRRRYFILFLCCTMKMSFIMYLIANYNCIHIEFSSLLHNTNAFFPLFLRSFQAAGPHTHTIPDEDKQQR